MLKKYNGDADNSNSDVDNIDNIIVNNNHHHNNHNNSNNDYDDELS
jgi:hypothetical protein